MYIERLHLLSIEIHHLSRTIIFIISRNTLKLTDPIVHVQIRGQLHSLSIEIHHLSRMMYSTIIFIISRNTLKLTDPMQGTRSNQRTTKFTINRNTSSFKHDI